MGEKKRRMWCGLVIELGLGEWWWLGLAPNMKEKWEWKFGRARDEKRGIIQARENCAEKNVD